MSDLDGLDPSPAIPAPVTLEGVRIHPVTPENLITTLVSWAEGPKQRRIAYVNVHAMNLADRSASFRDTINDSDIVFCDGMGVKWGARMMGVDVPHRMTPPDWIDAFAGATARAGQSVFALGDEPGVAERFQELLAERHPNYRSAGSYHGFFRKDGDENDSLIKTINDSGADHLLVGFGMPLQEEWLKRNGPRLQARVLLPVGALFRWYTGVEQRAPRWMTDHGLEWLARLAAHPVRHFQRYVVGNATFAGRLLRQRLLPSGTLGRDRQ